MSESLPSAGEPRSVDIESFYSPTELQELRSLAAEVVNDPDGWITALSADYTDAQLANPAERAAAIEYIKTEAGWLLL